MLFPVYIWENGTTLPETGTYYIVARDGLYIRKETGLITAVVKVPLISALEEVRPHAVLHLPKLSWRLTARMIGFLRAVWKRHGTEGLVLIHWNRVFGYRLAVPPQEVTAGSVDYDKTFRFPGFQLVGSVHSHPGSAGHSSIDQSDEQHFDGLHITIGYPGDKTHEISSQVVVNGNRFPVPPTLYLDGVELIQPVKKKEELEPLNASELRAMRRFGFLRDTARELTAALASPLQFGMAGMGGRMLTQDDFREEMKAYYAERYAAEKRYRVVVSRDHEKRAFRFPLRWMEAVTKVSFLREAREITFSLARSPADDKAPGTTGDEGGGT